MPVAVGEHVAKRVVFKQLLQAGAIDVMQIDACRVGSVNEYLANLLLAAKFAVPVCPHAGVVSRRPCPWRGPGPGAAAAGTRGIRCRARTRCRRPGPPR